jgi:translation elongation factor EF-4
MALEYGLEIIPVLNKIDLPAAQPERVAQQIENLIGIPAEQVLKVSAKTGQNVEQVLDAIIERIPDPATFKKKYREKFYKKELKGIAGRALIFDSVYDKYR